MTTNCTDEQFLNSTDNEWITLPFVISCSQCESDESKKITSRLKTIDFMAQCLKTGWTDGPGWDWLLVCEKCSIIHLV